MIFAQILEMADNIQKSAESQEEEDHTFLNELLIRKQLNFKLSVNEIENASSRARELLKEGRDYFTQGHFEKGVEMSRKAIQESPHFLEAYFQLGQAYANREYLYQAKSLFDQILNIFPEYYPAFYHLGHIAMSQGDLEKAMDYYQKALEFYPDHALAKVELGACLQGLELAKKYSNKNLMIKI